MKRHVATAILVVLSAALTFTAITAKAAEKMPRAEVEAAIPGYGYFMAVGFDSIWTANGDKLFRIHLVDNSIEDIPVEGAKEMSRLLSGAGLAVGEGAVWVPDDERQVIYRIDPQTHQVVTRAAPGMAGGSGGFIGVGERSVWVIVGIGKNELKRYSADTGAEEATIPLGSAGSDILAAFGSIWVTGTANDELYRIDPVANQVIATIDVHARPRSLAAGEGSVWVFNSGDGVVDRIDGKTGKLIATIETGEAARGAIDVGGGFVWVSTPLVPLIKIDPATHSVRGKFDFERTGYSGGSTVRYAGGSLWISGPLVRRITPPDQ